MNKVERWFLILVVAVGAAIVNHSVGYGVLTYGVFAFTVESVIEITKWMHRS